MVKNMDCFQEGTVTANTLESLFEGINFDDFDFFLTNFDNIFIEWSSISFFHNFFIFFNQLCFNIVYASHFWLRVIIRNALILDTVLIFLTLIRKIVVHLKVFLLDIFLCIIRIKIFLLDFIINILSYL